MTKFRAALVALCLAVPSLVLAQGLQVAFGSIKDNSEDPIEVTADRLEVGDETNTAIFSGGVVIGQGDMRLAAPKVRIVYREETDEISRMVATGGVTLVDGPDAAEAASAEYDLDAGTVEMRGNVLLTQERSAMTADTMTVNTDDGTAVLSGRVKTILQSSSSSSN